MTERPIILTSPEVRAIIDGRKTQLRRPITDTRIVQRADDWLPPSRCETDGCWVFTAEHGPGEQVRLPCHFGQPGTLLWVRAADGFANTREGRGGNWVSVGYEAAPDAIVPGKALFEIPMPDIMVKRYGLRVERVQDISEADAVAEGPTRNAHLVGFPVQEVEYTQTARDAFRRLWDSRNAARGLGWDANPWVWVVEFKRAGDER